jgi:predicted nucleic acid-binding protein
VIFLDTSAIYGLADSRDSNHERASELFRRALESGEEILVHNYVLIESTALLQNRLGLDSTLQFLRDTSSFTTHWIGREDHRRAVELLESRGRRGLSLVDCASFVVMRRYGVGEALAFDADFEREGFALYSGATG